MRTAIARSQPALPAPARKPRSVRTAIADELFAGVLNRERKRAHRSAQPFVLLRVSFQGRDAESAYVWRPIVESLEAMTRETDVIGWLRPRSVLGVLLTEVRSFGAAEAGALEARINAALTARLDGRTAAGCSLQTVVEKPAALEAEPADPPATIYTAMKRVLDVAGSLALLILLAPIFAVVAALVKCTSRGPVFYEQVRIGRMMKPFKMLKFRTMRANADHAIHQEYVTWFIRSSAQAARDGGPAPVFKLANDPRITPVGRVLRKTSLDELPQLWNVLQGEMSLVGPRPPLPYETEQYQPWHCRRVVEAKPGITGLWQVTGRSRTTFDEMVRLDLRYAKTCSLWTDIKILLATPRAVISGKGAC